MAIGTQAFDSTTLLQLIIFPRYPQ